MAGSSSGRFPGFIRKVVEQRNWRALLGGKGTVKGGGTIGLSPDELRRTVDPARLGFSTTKELEPIAGLIGQERALQAIRFGVSIRQPDFNLFVLGPNESGKTTAVRAFLEERARAEPPPPDWVYVNNFRDPDKPKALSLPHGRAARLQQSMVETLDELKTSLPAAFEGDDFRSRRRTIDETFRSAQEAAFEALGEKAKAEGVALMRTQTGFAMAPLADGKVMEPPAFEALPKPEKDAITSKIEALQRELASLVEEVPKRQKHYRQERQALNEDVATGVVRAAIADVANEFSDLVEVREFLDTAKADLIRNAGLFVLPETGENGEQEQAPAFVAQTVETARDARFRRYLVNVIVTNGKTSTGAPIIDELNPTHGNLVGRIEHIARMGALITDFLLIKPGALHAANGGYLLLDARKVLTSPYAWESLKRALKSRQIEIESPAEQFQAIQTQSLDPEPIPLNVKVVLFGDRQLFYLLTTQEPEFQRLFKVQADFDETIDWTPASATDYARLIASIIQNDQTKPADATAVARLIEQSARLADDNQKLSLEIGRLSDVVREADFWATEAGHSVITGDDVTRAIEESINRADRVRTKTIESFAREIMLLDTSGAKVGQINGLSVLSVGNFTFGRPSRITARVRMGAGRVTDIEREVELGGPLHSKGVMILWGFLAGKFAENVPLALAATLVFEQSYGGVDGDSASSTELYALLSALSGVPIKQGFAVTGSVNQFGEVQAIGGINEKIEGYFDICRTKGLDGQQAIMMPASNTQHLMLRQDVVDAVRAKQFAVYPVSTIDQGIELLTGVPAGERGPDGAFPKGTINRLVEDRLIAFADKRKSFEADKKMGGKEGPGVA